MQQDYRNLEVWHDLTTKVLGYPSQLGEIPKRQLLPVFFNYMQETEKPELRDNPLVIETRKLILQLEEAGVFTPDKQVRQ
jgi:hypothetical protein